MMVDDPKYQNHAVFADLAVTSNSTRPLLTPFFCVYHKARRPLETSTHMFFPPSDVPPGMEPIFKLESVLFSDQPCSLAEA
jgi:hypothetical protein